MAIAVEWGSMVMLLRAYDGLVFKLLLLTTSERIPNLIFSERSEAQKKYILCGSIYTK